MDKLKVLQEFVEGYKFNSLDDLKQLDDTDIMENLYDLINDNWDDTIEEMMDRITKMRKYQILYEFIHGKEEEN